MHRVAVLLAVAGLLSGCGGADEEPGVADVVPADAALLVELPLVEEDGPATLVQALGGPAELLQRLEGLDYDRDVAPWVGERAGAFAADGRIATVLEAEDEQAAERFTRRNQGALVAGHVVVGDAQAVAAARRAAGGPSLADTKPYEELDEEAADDEGLALVAPTALRGLARTHVSAVITTLGLNTIDAHVRGLDRPRGRTPTLGALPARARFAYASTAIGRDVRAVLAETDVLTDLRKRFGVNIDATLQAVAAGRLWIGDARHAGLDATPLDLPVLLRQARSLVRRERRAGKRLEAYLPRPGAEDDPFVQLFVGARGRDPAYSLEVEDELLDVDLGPEEDEKLLRDTPLYRDATRELKGEPSLLLDVSRMGDIGGLERIRSAAARDLGGGEARIVVSLGR